ncbi:MAG TPA: 2-C-methyl-D-erythritol 4-phosphate cytidylyltransferase, partial [Pirellulales bacterium]|nr:2-C-methyl-D-erythritol 4-phosphate cytidylyltransferase [Pirellulales bacterium]
QLVEAAGHPVYVVEGSAQNIKLTTKSDLFLAEAILKSRPKPKAAGPIHPFADEEMWGGRGKK